MGLADEIYLQLYLINAIHLPSLLQPYNGLDS